MTALSESPTLYVLEEVRQEREKHAAADDASADRFLDKVPVTRSIAVIRAAKAVALIEAIDRRGGAR